MTQKLILKLTIIAAVSTTAWAASTNKPDDQRKKSTVNNVNSTLSATTGDEVFQTSCSRCHTPPMSISPRTTGTVIMHMRTRARLSREDEVKLLRFMAP